MGNLEKLMGTETPLEIGLKINEIIEKGTGGGFNLFDTKLSDHILEGDEAKGWALQGTYVYKEAVAGVRDGYPTFYDDVLIKKQNATATEVTLGDSTITMYITNNGYQFYDIADREVIDNWYNTYGLAWFYGVDEANERIFLPRDKYFALKGIAPVVGNGIALTLTDNIRDYGLKFNTSGDSNRYNWYVNTGESINVGASVSNASSGTYDNAMGLSTDEKRSGIEAHLKSNENKYLYICVGNTTTTSAITEVVDVTTTENDTVPLFTGQYFDFTPNNVSWLKAGQQANIGGIYTTAYNELVNCLNGVNKYNLKVINTADMVSGVDYSEYWKVNQYEMYFVTPTKLSYGALTQNIVSNGLAVTLSSVGTGSTPVENATIDMKNRGGANGTVGTSSITNVTDSGILGFGNQTGLVAEESTTAQLYFKVANAVQNLELLNVGEITESLTNKCDVDLANCTKPYVIEVSDKSLLPSWYRVWSDGWIEQGGYYSDKSEGTDTITLLKEHSDSNYGVYVSCHTSSAASGIGGTSSGYALNTTQIVIIQDQDTNNKLAGTYWKTCGY